MSSYAKSCCRGRSFSFVVSLSRSEGATKWIRRRKKVGNILPILHRSCSRQINYFTMSFARPPSAGQGRFGCPCSSRPLHSPFGGQLGSPFSSLLGRLLGSSRFLGRLLGSLLGGLLDSLLGSSLRPFIQRLPKSDSGRAGTLERLHT
jgi:hypothetical protein